MGLVLKTCMLASRASTGGPTSSWPSPRLLSLSQLKFPFQLGKLLGTRSQASFEPTDLFPEILHNEINTAPAYAEDEWRNWISS